MKHIEEIILDIYSKIQAKEECEAIYMNINTYSLISAYKSFIEKNRSRPASIDYFNLKEGKLFNLPIIIDENADSPYVL